MQNRKKAIAWMLLSALGLALAGIFVKEAGALPVEQKIFIRTAITTLIAFFPFKSLEKKEMRFPLSKWFTIRVFSGLLGMAAAYKSYEFISLSDANIIAKSSAIMLIILSFIILKEPLNKVELSCIGFGFLGIILISKPSFNADMIGYIIALVGAICAAYGHLSLRIIGSYRNPKAIVFYFAACSTIILMPFTINSWVSMTFAQWNTLILAGIAGMVAQYGLAFAYSYAPAKEISIYSYMTLIFTGLYDATKGIYPDFISILGYFAIFSASLFLAKHGQKSK